MDERDMLEIRRKMFHLFLGLMIAFFVFFTKKSIGSYGYLVVVPILIVVFLLLLFPKLDVDIKLINHLLTHFERPHDREKFPFKGSIFYGLGVSLPILLLDLNVACAIIAVLSAGDAMSTLIGRFYGKIRRGHAYKSFEGLFAFIIFAFMAASLFVSWKLAFALAIVGSLFEFFSFFDDNFLVPAGLTAFYLFYMHFIIPFNLTII